MVKRLPWCLRQYRICPQCETRVRSLAWEDPLEKGMATHASLLARRIPWTEEPGRLRSKGWQRVGHDWVTSTHHSKERVIWSRDSDLNSVSVPYSVTSLSWCAWDWPGFETENPISQEPSQSKGKLGWPVTIGAVDPWQVNLCIMFLHLQHGHDNCIHLIRGKD